MFEASGVRVEALAPSGRKVLRRGKRQILLIAGGEQVFAVAARCPHEGYPLSEGTLSEAGAGSEAGGGGGCLLTCDWHNWKFDLATGAAVVGRDPVRTFPVEVRQGEIFLDLADPPPDQRARRALAGLEAAMDDDDPARMAREVARLERAGADARGALVHAIEHTVGRLEGGMTHAHAAAADWLALSKRAPDPDHRLAAMVEPIAHLAWDTLGAGPFPYPETVLAWDSGAFLSAMESEEEAGAIGRLRGALAEGMAYADLRSVLAEAALAHYADFGHSAIYVLKAGQLIDRLNGAAAEPILVALTRQLIYARREDRLPEFRAYGPALARWREGGGKAVTPERLQGEPVKRILERLCGAAARPSPETYGALHRRRGVEHAALRCAARAGGGAERGRRGRLAGLHPRPDLRQRRPPSVRRASGPVGRGAAATRPLHRPQPGDTSTPTRMSRPGASPTPRASSSRRWGVCSTTACPSPSSPAIA